MQDLPEPKENVKELFKGQPKLPMYIKETPVTSSNNNHLSNSRIKRHAETVALSKPSITTDRKTKKRKSLERYETNLVSTLTHNFVFYFLLKLIYEFILYIWGD